MMVPLKRPCAIVTYMFLVEKNQQERGVQGNVLAGYRKRETQVIYFELFITTPPCRNVPL